VHSCRAPRWLPRRARVPKLDAISAGRLAQIPKRLRLSFLNGGRPPKKRISRVGRVISILLLQGFSSTRISQDRHTSGPVSCAIRAENQTDHEVTKCLFFCRRFATPRSTLLQDRDLVAAWTKSPSRRSRYEPTARYRRPKRWMREHETLAVFFNGGDPNGKKPTSIFQTTDCRSSHRHRLRSRACLNPIWEESLRLGHDRQNVFFSLSIKSFSIATAN